MHCAKTYSNVINCLTPIVSIGAQLATMPTVVTVTKTTHWQLMDSPVSNVLHLSHKVK